VASQLLNPQAAAACQPLGECSEPAEIREEERAVHSLVSRLIHDRIFALDLLTENVRVEFNPVSEGR
jgi:hypothetical protein